PSRRFRGTVALLRVTGRHLCRVTGQEPGLPSFDSSCTRRSAGVRPRSARAPRSSPLAVTNAMKATPSTISTPPTTHSGLPSLGLPDVPAHRYFDLFPSALGVMLVGFAEGLGAAKRYAARSHDEIDVNQEFVTLGAASLGSGLSTGMVVNGSLSKTA